MKDLITIALPVYKRTDFIKSALDSAVNQTQECSILLIDNNSPHDDFKRIIDSYKPVKIKYVKTDETVPQDENFNNCFRYAETPWVTVLHDDDMLHCQYVEFSSEIINRYGDAVGGIAYPSFVGEEEWQGIGTRKEFTDDIKVMNPAFFFFRNIQFPGVLVKKDVALELGGFNSDLHPIADFDFWYRYSKRMQMIYANTIMSYYRISPSQSTNHLIDAMINNVYQYRMKEIKGSKYDNFWCKLAVEQARQINIDYFKDTYESVQIPELVNKEALKRANGLLKYGIIDRLARRYRRKIAFSKLP